MKSTVCYLTGFLKFQYILCLLSVQIHHGPHLDLADTCWTFTVSQALRLTLLQLFPYLVLMTALWTRFLLLFLLFDFVLCFHWRVEDTESLEKVKCTLKTQNKKAGETDFKSKCSGIRYPNRIDKKHFVSHQPKPRLILVWCTDTYTANKMGEMLA